VAQEAVDVLEAFECSPLLRQESSFYLERLQRAFGGWQRANEGSWQMYEARLVQLKFRTFSLRLPAYSLSFSRPLSASCANSRFFDPDFLLARFPASALRLWEVLQPSLTYAPTSDILSVFTHSAGSHTA